MVNFIENTLKNLIHEIKKELDEGQLICSDLYTPKNGQHLIYIKKEDDNGNDLSVALISWSNASISVIYREKGKSNLYTDRECKLYKNDPCKELLITLKEIEDISLKQLKESKKLYGRNK